jgi:hypothetical protein
MEVDEHPLASPQEFRAEMVASSASSVVIALHGEPDVVTAPVLDATLEEVCRANPRSLVLDLSRSRLVWHGRVHPDRRTLSTHRDQPARRRGVQDDSPNLRGRRSSKYFDRTRSDRRRRRRRIVVMRETDSCRLVAVYENREAALGAAEAVRNAGAPPDEVRVDQDLDRVASIQGEMPQELEHTVLGPGNVGPFTKEMTQGLTLRAVLGGACGSVVALPLAA